MKLARILIFLATCLYFFGCDDAKREVKTQETKEQTQSVLENLTLSTNVGTNIIVNQKAIAEQNNFKNIAPSKKEVLKDLIITNGKQNIKVLVFFTTWCEPCKGILPHLDNLQNQFGEQISLYGIALDDLVSQIDNFNSAIQVFISENEVKIPLILDENRKALFKALGGIEGVPLIVLYDKDGNYIIHYLGAIPEEMIEFDLAQSISKIKAQ